MKFTTWSASALALAASSYAAPASQNTEIIPETSTVSKSVDIMLVR